MKAIVLLVMVLSSGCITARGVGDAAGLRSKNGVCSVANSGMGGPGITTCFQVGSPKMLDDDGKTPKAVIHVTSSSLTLADPSGYQLEILKDGRVIFKDMLQV